MAAIGLAEFGEELLRVRRPRLRDRVTDPTAFVCGHDQSDPPIAGIGSAFDEPMVLQNVDHLRRGSRRDVQTLGEVRQPERCLVEEHP